jgi:hypothetical protein
VKSGSHLAGVFGKAVAQYETELRAKLRSTLTQCGISYDSDIRTKIEGKPLFTKLTLGQILHSLKELRRASAQEFPKCFRSGADLTSFFSQVSAVNKQWVAVKHGTGQIVSAEAVKQLKKMLATLEIAEI